jgi:hypothetical protein
MKRVFVPTQSGSDWQRLLAKPKLHWKKGRSAMTTHWEEPVVCECGHQGIVHWSENDQPFRNQWEQYSIEGFKGEGFHIAVPLLSAKRLSE